MFDAIDLKGLVDSVFAFAEEFNITISDDIKSRFTVMRDEEENDINMWKLKCLISEFITTSTSELFDDSLFEVPKERAVMVMKLHALEVPFADIPITDNTIFQLDEVDDGVRCILWNNENDLYCSNNTIEEFEFRDYKSVDQILEVDFYNLTEEDKAQIAKHFVFRKGY